MIEEIKAFEKKLRKQAPGIRTELNAGCHGDGAFMFGVWWRSKYFVMEYFPSHNQFGADEVLKHDAFNSGYRNVFDNFDEAASHFENTILGRGVDRPIEDQS